MFDICLLVSGGLGYEALVKLSASQKVVAIFTDNKSEIIIDFAHANNLPLFIGNPRNGKAKNFIETVNCDILFSINYLFIIESDIIQIPKRLAVNLHGSLLPKYRGRTPHVWAIINGEKEIGVTAHLIKEGVDTGDILLQKKIAIGENDTGAGILQYYKHIYADLIDNILRGIEENTLKPFSQNEQYATYFGKRTPEDGEINWNWHRERIKNWVRAQAQPYPGAFTWYNEKKVTIHKSESDEFGFNFQQANGTILFVGDYFLIVKVANGALKLSDINLFESFNFQINATLGKQ